MCNLYSQKSSLDEIKDWFDVEIIKPSAGNLPAQSAIFPAYNAPVVSLRNGRRSISMMKWGFVLNRRDKAIKHVNNCRDDKLLTSQFWRAAFFSRRCLVPVARFSEYHPSRLNENGHKACVWFELNDKKIFSFAGIWTNFTGYYKDQVSSFSTYSIVTTTPNDLVKQIHPSRMPVIIEPSSYETWLNGSNEMAIDLLKTYSENKMRIAYVGKNLDE